MKLTPARHYAVWQLMLLALLVPVLIALLLLPGRDLLTTTDVAMLQLLWVTWMAQQAGPVDSGTDWGFQISRVVKCKLGKTTVDRYSCYIHQI